MSPEASPSERPILKDHKDFMQLMHNVRLNPGKEMEIVTSVLNAISKQRGIRSQVGEGKMTDENKLNLGLEYLISEHGPKGETRASLEFAFNKKPDKTVHKSHSDIFSSEWPIRYEGTVLEYVVIGTRTTYDEKKKEITKSWYMRNTLKKPFLSFLKKPEFLKGLDR